MISKLYWYQAPTTTFRRQGIKSVLVDSKIWLSDPRTFRDPSEMRPQFRINGSRKEMEDYADYLLRYYDMRKRSPAERVLERSRLVRAIGLNPAAGVDDLH